VAAQVTETLAALLVFPGNRLEKLTGDRAGQYSVRVNRQWRICFHWFDAGARGCRDSCQRRISADTALRLARYFGTSERFWMNLQARYDLEVEKDRMGAAVLRLRREDLL
jgi:hypothetical protein